MTKSASNTRASRPRTSRRRSPSAKPPKLRILLDEGVPADVGDIFLKYGHEIIKFESVVTRGSRDELVCIAAEANNALLVAFDNDMKQLAQRHGVSAARFKRLNLLKFECDEPMAAARLEEAMSLLDHEWGIGSEKAARRLFLVISKGVMRTHR